MATTSRKKLTNSVIYPVLPIFNPINWKKILGRTLMTCGCFLIVGTIFLTQMAYITPTKQTVVFSKETSNTIYPTSIKIQNRSLDLEKDTFKYGLWPLSDEKPVYLETSGTPGQSGNIVIYGHNTPKIFANLHNLQQGSEVTLITNDNQTFTYQINSIKKVFPQDVEILQQGREEQITLFTCTGLFDSMRLVVSGKRI
jgi:LPXTG-site transpeptidase (sortase) family protein